MPMLCCIALSFSQAWKNSDVSKPDLLLFWLFSTPPLICFFFCCCCNRQSFAINLVHCSSLMCVYSDLEIDTPMGKRTYPSPVHSKYFLLPFSYAFRPLPKWLSVATLPLGEVWFTYLYSLHYLLHKLLPPSKNDIEANFILCAVQMVQWVFSREWLVLYIHNLGWYDVINLSCPTLYIFSKPLPHTTDANLSILILLLSVQFCLLWAML